MSAPISVPRANANNVLLAGFLATVVMLFAGFTTAYLIRKEGSDWSPVSLPSLVWGNTLLLVVSSVTVELACRRQSRGLIQASLALGLVFLVGQIAAWSQLNAAGSGVQDNAYAAFFYMLSAVHGLHVVGGLAIMLRVLLKRRPWRTCANYWHFMGVVWIYVLILLLGV
jgi:cytochrome c oxidase subunit 3